MTTNSVSDTTAGAAAGLGTRGWLTLIPVCTGGAAADLLAVAGIAAPVLVSYYGDRDDLAPVIWAARTAATARVVVLPGDHRFPERNPEPLLADLPRRVHAHSDGGPR